MSEPLLAVFDCTVFAQALINPEGPAGSCLTAAQAGHVRLFVSDYVIQEIRELPQKLPARLGVTSERVLTFILDLAKYSEPVENIPDTFAYDRDQDDAHYVNLAEAVKATFLVSRDNDLLDLMKNDGFKTRFPNLRVMSPPHFQREIEFTLSQTKPA